MPKYHGYRILVGVSPSILPTSLLTSYRSSLIALRSHISTLPPLGPGGDLQDAWLMFNTYKLKGWTTMACHIYDLVYRHVMTIVICKIQY